MGGYILAILLRIILKQGNIWDTQKAKQKGYLNKNLKTKEKEMNKHDIDKLVRWAVDSDLRKFSEDAYGVTGTAFDVASEGDYLRGKFKQMQSNFIMWISGLSNNNRERLTRAIIHTEKTDTTMKHIVEKG